jgi:hypothetical protein
MAVLVRLEELAVFFQPVVVARVVVLLRRTRKRLVELAAQRGLWVEALQGVLAALVVLELTQLLRSWLPVRAAAGAAVPIAPLEALAVSEV